jgi:arylsulfatase A-like enzyme
MSPPNVLLIILDSTRARNCSLYGYKNATTPFLDRLADEAVLFDHARAPSIHSIASHASIWTGYHVEEHQITAHESFLTPDRTIWHCLATDYGYETGLFTPNVVVTQTSNLGDVFGTCVGPKRVKTRLFDRGLAPSDVQGGVSSTEYLRLALRHDDPVRSLLNGLYVKLNSRGGSHDPESEHASVYVSEFLDWLNDRSGPWAACLNLMDTHTPFAPKQKYDLWRDEESVTTRRTDDEPDPFTDAYWNQLAGSEPLYDGTIRQADAAVERLVTALRDAGLLNETLLVVTSDHGEGFGERCELDASVRLRHHSWGIDEVLTHVPLLVRPPGGASGSTVSDPVSLTSFPTAVERTMQGATPEEAFAPEGPVVSSTYRIRPPGDELDLPMSERRKYFGPWRAVYRATDAGVVKFARRGQAAVELLVRDAQTIERRADDDGGVVEETFSSFEPVGIELGSVDDRVVDDAVEDRLADLGYLR